LSDIVVIDLQSISYSYPARNLQESHPALDEVTLSIDRGEFIAILGANGSGKSTLAKHMNALLVPQSGRAILCGMESSSEENIPRIRQQVAMVFQNPDNQIVATVVEEDVAFGPENLGLSTAEIQERVDAALAAVGLGAYRHFAPHLLSGGQKQRVAIAGAIAMRPTVLICDEATAMLDPAGRRDILLMLHELHREGMTIILITHDPREAIEADRVIMMQEGRVATQGSPKSLLTDLDLLHALNLEAPAMVELAAKLQSDGLLPAAGILTIAQMQEALWRIYEP